MAIIACSWTWVLITVSFNRLHTNLNFIRHTNFFSSNTKYIVSTFFKFIIVTIGFIDLWSSFRAITRTILYTSISNNWMSCLFIESAICDF